MNKAKAIISSIMDAQPAIPPAIIQNVKQSGIPQEFLAYIKRVENPTKQGYKNGKWYPIPDPAYGDIVGYGHQLSGFDLIKAKQGLTDADVEALLVYDLVVAKRKVYHYITTKYGATIQLNPRQEQMLMDYAFNLGGLEKFPKMVDAVLRWDVEAMKQQHKRFATIGGKKQELSGRNAAFSRAFLPK